MNKNIWVVMPLTLLSLLFSISCKNGAPEQLNSKMLFDFEKDIETSLVQSQDASYEIINEGDNKLLRITNGFSIKEPGGVLKSPIDKSWNLAGYYQVKADVSNIGEEDIQVEMFVGNDPDGLIRWYCSDYVDLKPGESKTIAVPLAWTPWVFKPQLKVEGMRGVPGKLKTDISKIQEITINSRYAYKENHFTIDNVRAEGILEIRDTTNFFPFVDEFGQYKHEDWKTKIKSIDQLKQVDQTNNKKLLALSNIKNRNDFGGWTAGPKLRSTGFFRTEKYDGKWWMVDPEGYLFLSSGVNCVASESVHTGITGREHYFENLPKNEGVNSQFYSKGFPASHGFYKGKGDYDMFNFYQHNLFKKYGSEWKTNFRKLAHERFKKWGLNTIGFMSDFGLFEEGNTPYVGSVWINGTPKIEGSEGFWGKFHDVFDPGFRLAVRKSIESQKRGAGDPWCIGFFVDNELSWGAEGSLAIGTLKSPAKQPAKLEFIKYLKKKYKNIADLNNVWDTNHSTWQDLLNTGKAPDTKKAEGDLLFFYEKIAETYFKIVKEELEKVAPGQNYLGCRFAWKNNAIVLKAAAKYMDVMSFNKYEYSVENVKLPKGVDKPILISEFHFGSTDRGSYHPGVKAAMNQEDRGKLYKEYVEGALRNPFIIGTHWFQYLDEPFTGRFDGENYNVGLLDVNDNPHDELVNKIREVHESMYEYRSSH